MLNMKNNKLILIFLALSITISTISPIWTKALEKSKPIKKENLSIKTNFELNNGDIAKLQNKLDTYSKAYIKNTPIPGMAITVVKGNKAIFTKGYGIESVNTKKSVTKYSSILIGSLTKSFTALALVQLEEQGKLNLNDPVIKYLPYFKALDKNKSDKITIKMLLSHTSGIKAIDNELLTFDESDNSTKKILEEISNMPLERNPGTGFEYCNEGFDIAGLVIEAVSGMKYEKYIEKNILTALDMRNSTTDPKKSDKVNAIFGHLADVTSGVQINKIKSRLNLAAGSLLSCSAEDLSHYLIALLNEGKYNGKQIVSKNGIEKLWTPLIQYPVTSEYSALSDDGSVGYGLGWNISNIQKKAVIHHGGNTFGTSSYTIIHPETKTAISVLFNVGNTDIYKYMDIVTLTKNLLNISESQEIPLDFKSELKDPYIDNFNLPSNLNKKYIGEYENEDGNKQIKIIEDKNKNLILQQTNYFGTTRGILDFASETSANIRSTGIAKSISFTTTSEGEVVGLTGFINAKRKNPSEYKNYETINYKQQNLSFILPKYLNITFENNAFIAKDKDNTIDIKATIWQKDKVTFDNLLSESTKHSKITEEFKEYIEMLSGKLCTEKSYIIEKNNKQYTKLIVSVSFNDKVIFIDSEIESNKATRELTQTLIPLVKSLK